MQLVEHGDVGDERRQLRMVDKAAADYGFAIAGVSSAITLEGDILVVGKRDTEGILGTIDDHAASDSGDGLPENVRLCSQTCRSLPGGTVIVVIINMHPV